MMGTRTLSVGVAVFVALMAVAPITTAQGKEPWVGTWKLNLAKSSYSPGPAPQSSTLTSIGRRQRVLWLCGLLGRTLQLCRHERFPVLRGIFTAHALAEVVLD